MPDGLSVTICVDALKYEMSGIGRYTWELCRHVASHPKVATTHYFIHHRLISQPGRLLEGRFRAPAGPARLFARMRAKRALRSTIVHAPNYFLPRGTEVGVMTVHDLSVFKYPDAHPVERVRQFERLFFQSLERAAHIVTDSETVRRELAAMFAVPAAKITAVPLGVSERFQPIETAATAADLQRWGLRPDGFGLCVSAVEPRKKVAELVRAWRCLPTSTRNRFPLVIAGGSGWNNEAIRKELAQAVEEGWLKHLGHVSEAELAQLYAAARLFIYPSIYEGFGLPPIEAMASGTPVIVSNRSCLPEVCGDAARYIDPDDQDEFASAIEGGLLDEAWRLETMRKGLAHAGRLTWARCAAETVAVYAQLAG